MGPSSLITTLCYLWDIISWGKLITDTTGRRKDISKDRGKEDTNTEKRRAKGERKIGCNEEKQ